MPLINWRHHFLFCLLALWSSSLFAQYLTEEQQAARFLEAASFWQETCGNNQSLPLVKFDDSANYFDCAHELKRLDLLYLDLSSREFFSSNDKQCLADAEQLQVSASNFGSKLEEMLKSSAPDPSCQQSISDCMGDLYCNAFASFIPGGEKLSQGLYQGAAILYRKLDLEIDRSSSLQQLKKCGENKSGNCLRSVLRGVFDSIFTTLDAFWQLGKMAVNSGWKWLSKQFSSAEELTSDKLLVASQLDDSLLDQLMADPLAMVQKMAKSIYDLSIDAIKTHYGCQKWSGEAMASTCLEPMDSWECADCALKMNAVCGVLGFAGGEIISSFITGGMVGAGKAMLTPALKVGAKGMSKMAPLIAPLKKVTVAPVRQLSHLVERKWSSVLHHPAVSKVANSKSYRVVMAAPSAASKGVKEYFSLMDQAFVSGMRFGEELPWSVMASKTLLAPKTLRLIESSDSLRQVYRADPETMHFLFAEKDMALRLEGFLSKASAAEKGKFAQIVSELTKRKIPADRIKWREKLDLYLKSCLK